VSCSGPRLLFRRFRRHGAVPEEIEAVLTAFANKHALETLANVRRVVSLGSNLELDRDVAKTITEQMSWHEVIHTSYFQVDEFAKLVAYVLYSTGVAHLKESFLSDPDYVKVKSAHDCLSPLIVKETTPIKELIKVKTKNIDESRNQAKPVLWQAFLVWRRPRL